ncbi:T9SS type A sorting domain-containing protein [candidate division KSB1 bacterium]|nr:T9SS type A sorting domain-containing protein [candidate division KSB1 bacterium]
MLKLNIKPVILLIITVVLLYNTMLLSQSKGGEWRFENNALDTADWDSVENNGVLQNLAGFDTTPPLQEGDYYLWLDSANKYDFVKIDDSNDLDFDNENIGISAWIYPLAVGDDVHWILNKGDQFTDPKTTNYSLRISKSSNLEFLIRDSQNKAVPIASSFKIPQDQWTFVAIFYDYSSKKIHMWNTPSTDPVDVLDYDQNYFSNNDPLAIGSWFSSEPSAPSIKDFEGRIDDVKISGRLDDILPEPTSVQKFHNNPHPPAQMSIYPNPASLTHGDGMVSLLVDMNAPKNSTIQIFNVLGQRIFQAEISNTGNPMLFNWNLNDSYNQPVNTGIYFVRVQSMDQYITQKLVIIK